MKSHYPPCKVCGRQHHPWKLCEWEEDKRSPDDVVTGLVLCLIGFLIILAAAAGFSILTK